MCIYHNNNNNNNNNNNLGARGVWEPQAMALFDIRVVDTDAKSYSSHSPAAVLASAEEEVL